MVEQTRGEGQAHLVLVGRELNNTEVNREQLLHYVLLITGSAVGHDRFHFALLFIIIIVIVAINTGVI